MHTVFKPPPHDFKQYRRQDVLCSDYRQGLDEDVNFATFGTVRPLSALQRSAGNRCAPESSLS